MRGSLSNANAVASCPNARSCTFTAAEGMGLTLTARPDRQCDGALAALPANLESKDEPAVVLLVRPHIAEECLCARLHHQPEMQATVHV